MAFGERTGSAGQGGHPAFTRVSHPAILDPVTGHGKPADRRGSKRFGDKASAEDRPESPEDRAVGRPSRATVPIAPEDLRQLIGATAVEHSASSSSSRPTPAGLPALGSLEDLQSDVNEDDPTAMTAEQEFGASGGSISEALTSVAQQRGAGPGEQAAHEIGDMGAIPQLLVPLQEVTWHKLDHQAGFLLSRVDGMLSYADLLTISGMPEPQALRILARLIELKLIGPTA